MIFPRSHTTDAGFEPRTSEAESSCLSITPTASTLFLILGSPVLHYRGDLIVYPKTKNVLGNIVFVNCTLFKIDGMGR